MLVQVKDVIVKKRIRKELQDIQALKESMSRYGLMNPITINSNNELIAGHRRLEAAKELGWNSISAVVIDPKNEILELEMELEENIQNELENTTRFVVISREAVLPEDANKISLCFALPHVTGSLFSVLERFAMAGLNLTKIESRPLPGKNFEYDFYLDFTGNIHQSGTLELICSLSDELPRFSFLGNYSER